MDDQTIEMVNQCQQDRLKRLDMLREPFLPEQIHKKPQPTINIERWNNLKKGHCMECGGWHPAEHTIHLSYVGHAELTRRLLEVDPEWNWEPCAIDPTTGGPVFDKNGGMWITLTICGVTRRGYGDAGYKKGANAVKEAIGDALRNAAMRFGAALDLWSKDMPEEPGEKTNENEPQKENSNKRIKFYPEDNFKANYPKWEAAILDKENKTTALGISRAVKSKGFELTKKQFELLESIPKGGK